LRWKSTSRKHIRRTRERSRAYSQNCNRLSRLRRVSGERSRNSRARSSWHRPEVPIRPQELRRIDPPSSSSIDLTPTHDTEGRSVRSSKKSDRRRTAFSVLKLLIIGVAFQKRPPNFLCFRIARLALSKEFSTALRGLNTR
jgi:hypothetical protein